MNICFLGRHCYDKFSVALANSLNEKIEGNNFYFITDIEKETRYINENVKGATVFELPQYVKKYWSEGTVEKLSEIENKYDCEPIWEYIYTDRFLIYKDYEYCVRTTVSLFLMYEEIFSKNEIDYYYSEAISTLQCYIAYLVGRKLGVHYISQMPARGELDANYHYALDGPFQYVLHETVSEYENYTKDEIEAANSFLKEFESKDLPPRNMIYVSKRPRFSFKFLLLPFFRFIKSFDKNLNDPYSYIYFKSYKTITDPIVFYFRYINSIKYYNMVDYSKKYVYYPLHYQPEASTIVCAQKYEKQLFFIDSLAKSLPADTILYVKEHYAILGHRPTEFYHSLKQYPNVVLIDPWESSRKMIENAQAVVTLTGTAGWEAMLLRKPVIIGGNIFFDTAPGVIKVDDIYKKYSIIINSWKRPDRDETVRYLCKHFRSLYEGNLYAQAPISLEKKNISIVTEALIEIIEKLKNGGR